MGVVANVGNGGSIQVSTTPKRNELRPPTYNGARSARKINNFIWGLEAFFEAGGIKDETQKVNNVGFTLKNIVLVWWCSRFKGVRRGSDPINVWDMFKKEVKVRFYPKDAEH